MDRATRRQQSDRLHARACAMVDAFEHDAEPPESLDALACDVARFQAAASPGYARLCESRGIDLERVASVAELPAVPTDAFKLTRVATFDEDETALTFRTSGTTIGARGAHAFRDVSTYDRGALAFGRRWLARDLEGRFPIVVLGPSPAEAPDSSLTHMCATFVRELGAVAPGDSGTWILSGEVFDLSAFDERVAYALANDQPMLVLATSFALVHFLDAIGDDTFALPVGSRVMQTGGFKGKSREVAPDALRSDVARAFAVPPRAVVSEYGMTELSSQFYERTIFDEAAKHGFYAEPPWARVIPVDPETLVPVADGEIGIAKIVDGLNVDSAVAVLTNDRVRRAAGQPGFELLGRAPGAPPRGCSIGIDELLSRA